MSDKDSLHRGTASGLMLSVAVWGVQSTIVLSKLDKDVSPSSPFHATPCPLRSLVISVPSYFSNPGPSGSFCLPLDHRGTQRCAEGVFRICWVSLTGPSSRSLRLSVNSPPPPFSTLSQHHQFACTPIPARSETLLVQATLQKRCTYLHFSFLRSPPLSPSFRYPQLPATLSYLMHTRLPLNTVRL